MSDDESLIKIYVNLPHHWATGGEAFWAEALGGDHYRLENVPFYAYDLNFHDVVEARATSAEEKPSILRVVERSGNRTLRVFFEDGVGEDERLARLQSLSPLHVSFERCSAQYFALDLESDADLSRVRAELAAWGAEGIASHETCEARVPGSFDDAPATEPD
jgi:Domain of unknown function (DUF4265)